MMKRPVPAANFRSFRYYERVENGLGVGGKPGTDFIKPTFVSGAPNVTALAEHSFHRR